MKPETISRISFDALRLLRKSIGKIFAIHLAYTALGLILFTPLVGIISKLLLRR